MRFKDWIKNEVELNLTKPPVAASSNPIQSVKATDNVAQNTIDQFGPQLIQNLGKAPNPVQAGKVAVDFAQKSMSKAKQPTANSSTNAMAVGAKIYNQATGKDLKTMGKK